MKKKCAPPVVCVPVVSPMFDGTMIRYCVNCLAVMPEEEIK